MVEPTGAPCTVTLLISSLPSVSVVANEKSRSMKVSSSPLASPASTMGASATPKTRISCSPEATLQASPSLTLKENAAVPLQSPSGSKVKRPASTSALLTIVPGTTAAPLRRSSPLAGSDSMRNDSISSP